MDGAERITRRTPLLMPGCAAGPSTSIRPEIVMNDKLANLAALLDQLEGAVNDRIATAVAQTVAESEAAVQAAVEKTAALLAALRS